MIINGTKIKLVFDEPWDAPKTITGHIIQQSSAADGKIYLLIEELNSNEIFIVTNRYKGDNLANISMKKKGIVAIFKPPRGTFSFDEKDFTLYLLYLGVGSIDICEE